MKNVRLLFIASLIFCTDAFAWDISAMKSSDLVQMKRNSEELMQRREALEDSQVRQNALLLARISELEAKVTQQQELIKTYNQLVAQLQKELEVAKNAGR